MSASLIGERIQDQLDRRSAISLQQQLYRHLRELIEEGTLRPSSRLPSSRSLATQLSVSRITIMAAFDMLTADGWYLTDTRGDHHYFKHKIKSGKITVPHPKKDLPQKTIASILKQAGLK